MGEKSDFASAGGFSGKIWREGKFTHREFHIRDGKIQSGRREPVVQADYIIPPFTDPHIHGGWGWDIQKGHFAELEKQLIREGIFCAVPALDNNSFENLQSAAEKFVQYKHGHPGSIYPFLRAEGPFIHPSKRGFQKSRWIQTVSPESMERLLGIPSLRMITFAPELPGSGKLVKRAFESGIIPSAGHSRASYEEFLQVYRMGVRHMTHFPNAMSGFHHREIGLTGAGLLLDKLQLEIIGDGIHTCRQFLSLLRKDRTHSLALVSDMIPPAFSRQVRFDGRKLIRKGDRITTQRGILAGGATPVSKQAARLFEWGWAPENLVRTACENARIFMGLKPPSLEEGNPADFLIMDEKMKLKAVYKQGRCIAGEKND